MSELGAILTSLYAGEIQSPRQLSGGARLYWSAKRQELLIARVNHLPPENEMAIFRRYIRQAGFSITGERVGAPIAESLNSWHGYALKLEPAREPEPQAEQLMLIE